MSDVVRINSEHKELLEQIADQLDTSIKDVVDHILDWFFNDEFGTTPDPVLSIVEGIIDDLPEEEEEEEEED